MIYIYNYKFVNREDTYIKDVMILEIKEVNQDKISYLVKYEGCKFLVNIYISDKELNIEELKYFKYGDIIKIKGKIKVPKLLNNPNEFNYKRYLNSNKVVGYINTYSVKKVGENNTNILLKSIYTFKNMLSEKICNSLPEEKANLFKSMIYGENINLDTKIEESLSRNGLSHIISVSGTNIFYLFSVIDLFFKTEEKKKNRGFLDIVILSLFCILASFSISILRATIMSIISIISKNFNIKLKKYTSLILSALLIFLYNPFCIFNIGFIFSYLAVISIIVYQKEIYSLIDLKIKKILHFNYVENNKIKKKVYVFLDLINKVISVYISVQILILPIQVYYFGQFSLTTIFSNIIIYPITLGIFLFGFWVLFLAFIPVVSSILFNIEYLMLSLLVTVSDWLINIYLPIRVPKPSIIIVVFYYIFLFLFRYRKKTILVIKKEKVKLFKHILNFLLFVYLSTVFLGYIYVLYIEEYIYFFNVEQGNMGFIRYKGKNILIDCGSTSSNLASNVLSNFCKQKGIRNIDVLFITHMHDDHINCLFTNSDITIDKIIYSNPKLENENYYKIKKLASDNNISLLESNIFDKYSIKDLEIYVLSPKNNKNIIANDIENANSQVLLFSIENTNILFMGDATIETENFIIDNIRKIEDEQLKQKLEEKLKNLEIIQVGHHGSKTSTSKKFLEYINVKKAIISAKKEKFGHPHQETVDKLDEYNILTYCTESKGAVKFLI